MINFRFNNYIKFLKKINLSKDEKRSLRVDFITRAEMSPDLHSISSQKAFIKSPFSQWQLFLNSKRVQLVLASVLVFIMVGSGTVSAANQSLPGDILYPVKKGVNEKVARFFHSVSPASEATFELSLVTVRLNEAEQLSKRNELTLQNKDEIKQGVIDQTLRAVQALSVAQASIKTEQTSGTSSEETKTNFRFGKNRDTRPSVATDDQTKQTHPQESIVKKNTKSEATAMSVRLASSSSASTTFTITASHEIKATTSVDSSTNIHRDGGGYTFSQEVQNQQNGAATASHSDAPQFLEKVFEKHQDIIQKLDLSPHN